MFNLPDAKRVRRDDLFTRDSSSPSPSPPPASSFPDAHKRLSALLNLDIATQPTAAPPTPAATQEQKENNPEDEEQEFEFRLFSAPAAPRLAGGDGKDGQKAAGGDTTTTTNGPGGAQKLRIRLRSPTPTTVGAGEGRFVNPFRGWSYYFSTPGLLSGESKNETGVEDAGVLLKRKQFEDVAVSGEDMVGFSGVPWPGCHLPWRVIHLKREHTKIPKDEKGTASSAATYVAGPSERETLSRKKPGKKRRIQLRKRATVAERAKETEAEKRNRKNRERKIKRRQKARDLRAATAATEGGADDHKMELSGDASGQES
ncbi:hypothetical protein BDW62DRAFT_172538, partial [Aspergillus aurantiobrunneus]